MCQRNHPALEVSNIKKLIPVVLGSEHVKYSSWSTLFCVTARAYNALHHIDCTVDPPSDTSVWAQLDAVVISWIYATISPDLLVAILADHNDKSTAMDVWTCLRGMFQCHQNYNTTSINPSTSLYDNYNRKGKVIVRQRKSNAELNLDFISDLHDDILVYFLSFLEMKEAGRTSILSKRWRYVWTYLMDLDFAPATNTTMGADRNWVNKVMTASRAPYLNTFRIHNHGRLKLHAADIDTWFKFAITKKVRKLEFNLYPHCLGYPTPTIQFPNLITSAPILLNLNMNNTLESLHLDGVYINGPLLQWILNYCSNLRHFSLHHCHSTSPPAVVGGFSNPEKTTHTQLVVSSLNLRHLEFFCCFNNLGFEALHISAPKLSSIVLFQHHNFNVNIFTVEYGSVPSLVDAAFGWLHCRYLFDNLDIISAFSFQLEKLTITWDEELFRLQGFPTFANLKHLKICYSPCGLHIDGHDLLKLTSFIEACPSLHIFKLEVNNVYSLVRSPIASFTQIEVNPHKHLNLKVVELIGFDGSGSAVQLAHCMIRRAPMLKKFVFDTRHLLQGEHQMAVARYMAEMIAKTIQGHVDVLIF